MRKEAGFAIVLLVILSAGAFAQSVDLDSDVQNYIKSFANKGGVLEKEIKTISEIDQASLPDNVDIREISNNKVGIYSVNYSENGADKSIYVITYATQKLKQGLSQQFKTLQKYNRLSPFSFLITGINRAATQ